MFNRLFIQHISSGRGKIGHKTYQLANSLLKSFFFYSFAYSSGSKFKRYKSICSEITLLFLCPRHPLFLPRGKHCYQFSIYPSRYILFISKQLRIFSFTQLVADCNIRTALYCFFKNFFTVHLENLPNHYILCFLL